MLRDTLVFIAATVGAARYSRFAPYQPKLDYIGPEAWTTRRSLRPLARLARLAYGVDYNPAGWAHDELYRQGGCESDRLRADNDFLSIMLFIAERHKGPLGMLQRHLARLRAQTLYHFVREQGRHFFEYHEVPTC